MSTNLGQSNEEQLTFVVRFTSRIDRQINSTSDHSVTSINPPTESAIKLPHVREFDGVRGLLAVWVMLAHLACWTGLEEIPVTGMFGTIWNTLTSASAAVDVFIILSGFVITFLLEQKRLNYVSYMTGRWCRIFPTYIVALVFGILVSGLAAEILDTVAWRQVSYFDNLRSIAVAEQSHPCAHGLLHLTLLNGLVPAKILYQSTATFLPPGWSITLEWQYYLVAPLILRLSRSGSGLLLLTVTAVLGVHFGFVWQNSHLAFLPAKLPLFLIGQVSYFVYSHLSASSGRGRSSSLSATLLIIAAVATQWRPVALVLWSLSFGSVFAGDTDILTKILTPIRRILNSTVLQWLGRISYPIYLLHWPVIILCLSLLSRWSPGITSSTAAGWMLFSAVPITLVTALNIHFLVERPMMKLSKRMELRALLPRWRCDLEK